MAISAAETTTRARRCLFNNCRDRKAATTKYSAAAAIISAPANKLLPPPLPNYRRCTTATAKLPLLPPPPIFIIMSSAVGRRTIPPSPLKGMIEIGLQTPPSSHVVSGLLNTAIMEHANFIHVNGKWDAAPSTKQIHLECISSVKYCRRRHVIMCEERSVPMVTGNRVYTVRITIPPTSMIYSKHSRW
jgi:hypothetical protein